MKKLSATILALTLALGGGAAFAPAYAQDDDGQAAGDAATASQGEAAQDETLIEKLEKDFKETTTPTDEETDAIGTSEDAGRDLY